MNIPITSLSPLRDYTETELLALPADSRLLFADNVHNGLITYGAYPTEHNPFRRRRMVQPRGSISPAHLQSALSRVRALHCISHGLSSFSLYPTNEQEYNVTKFLWRAANNVTFEAREAAALFQRNVFIISMPASLFDFLISVTWEQVEYALIYILICLADGHDGVEVLREDLAPALIPKVEQFAATDDPTSLVSPHAFRMFVDVIMDRIAWMGPWIVQTTLCYLSASDMTQLLSNRYDREIFSSPEKFELVQSMMWNIYRDWQTYHHVLVRNGEWSRRDSLEVMACMILKKGQATVDEAMRAVMDLCNESEEGTHSCLDIPSASRRTSLLTRPEGAQLVRRKKSLLATLPSDVVLNKVFPKLFEVHVADLREKIRSDLSTGSRSGIEPASPVTVPFSLKNWILENYQLEAFYRRCESGSEAEELGDAEIRDDVFVEVEVVDAGDGDEIIVDVGEQFDDAKFSDDDDDDDDDDNMVEIAEPIADSRYDGADSMAVEEDLSDDLNLDKDLEDVEAITVEYVDGVVRDVVVIDLNAHVSQYDGLAPRATS